MLMDASRNVDFLLILRSLTFINRLSIEVSNNFFVWWSFRDEARVGINTLENQFIFSNGQMLAVLLIPIHD